MADAGKAKKVARELPFLAARLLALKALLLPLLAFVLELPALLFADSASLLALLAALLLLVADALLFIRAAVAGPNPVPAFLLVGRQGGVVAYVQGDVDCAFRVSLYARRG